LILHTAFYILSPCAALPVQVPSHSLAGTVQDIRQRANTSQNNVFI